MKKLFLLALSLTLGFVFVSCAQEDTTPIDTEEQVFTLQALSSTSLLNYNELTADQVSLDLLANSTMEEPKITSEVENIDYYVEMMDLFLGDDNLTVVSETSDNEAYAYKTVYTTKSINGEDVIYFFYYNSFDLEEQDQNQEQTDGTTTEEVINTEEIITTEETSEEPVTEPLANSVSEKAREFRFQDEDDNLVVLGLEGILIYNDITYNIEGKKVVNSNQEIFRLRSFIDEDNYVVVNYQNDITDRDREKFFFKVVEAGITTNEAKVMMFSQNDRLHAKLEFVEGENYSSYIFNIRTEEEISYIFINYSIEKDGEVEEGNVRLTAEIDEATGDVIYNYAMTPNRGNQGPHENSFRHHHGEGNSGQQNSKM